jgi:hypothetical protein
MLERFPKIGDYCRVGTLEFHIVDISGENDLIVQMTVNDGEALSI